MNGAPRVSFMEIKLVVISSESQYGTHVSLSLQLLASFLDAIHAHYAHPCSSFLPLYSGIDLSQIIKYLLDHLP